MLRQFKDMQTMNKPSQKTRVYLLHSFIYGMTRIVTLEWSLFALFLGKLKTYSAGELTFISFDSVQECCGRACRISSLQINSVRFSQS